jgi:transcriptional regulator
MATDRLKGNLDLLLLAALAAGPAHGYALVRRLRDRSDGVLDLQEGTVYPALHRLEHEGFITSSWTEGERRPRKVYALSGAGQRKLAGERAEWDRFRAAVGSILGGTA